MKTVTATISPNSTAIYIDNEFGVDNAEELLQLIEDLQTIANRLGWVNAAPVLEVDQLYPHVADPNLIVLEKQTVIKNAEALILQMSGTHDGRNTWLMNYGVSDEAERIRASRTGYSRQAQRFELDPSNPDMGSKTVTVHRSIGGDYEDIHHVLNEAEKIITHSNHDMAQLWLLKNGQGHFSKMMRKDSPLDFVEYSL